MPRQDPPTTEGADKLEDDADEDAAPAITQPDVAAAVPAGPVELGFDPPCVERIGTELDVLHEGGALVVARPGTVSVWLPGDGGDDAIRVAVS